MTSQAFSTNPPALKPCPFCGSAIRPSPGLPGIYQHAENVHTCIIGDLGIASPAAWNRRTPADDIERLREALRAIKSLTDTGEPDWNDAIGDLARAALADGAA